jgi:glutaredoxin
MSALKTKQGAAALAATAALAAAAVCVSGFWAYRVFSQKTPIDLYVFDTCGGCNVQNPCKPCTVFQELTNRYKRLLAENGLRDKTELKPYNIYFTHDAGVYRRNLSAAGLEEAPVLPAALIGGRLLSGETSLKMNLVSAVQEERRLIRLIKQFAGFAREAEVSMGVYDTKTIVNFSLPSCEDCRKTNVLLAELEDVTIITIDPSSFPGRTLYEKYCETYGVPVNDYAVPRIFAQKSSFLGCEETAASLEQVLSGNSKTIKIELDGR